MAPDVGFQVNPIFHELGHLIQDFDGGTAIHAGYNEDTAFPHPYMQELPYACCDHLDDDLLWGINHYENADVAYSEGFANFVELILSLGVEGCNVMDDVSPILTSVPPWMPSFASFDNVPLHFDSQHRPLAVTAALCDLVDEQDDLQTWIHHLPEVRSPGEEHINEINLSNLNPGNSFPDNAIVSNMASDQQFAYGVVGTTIDQVPTASVFRTLTLSPGSSLQQVFDGSQLFESIFRVAVLGDQLCFIASLQDNDSTNAIDPASHKLFCSDKAVHANQIPSSLNPAFVEVPIPDSIDRIIDIKVKADRLFLLGENLDVNAQGESQWKVMELIPSDIANQLPNHLALLDNNWRLLATTFSATSFVALGLQPSTQSFFLASNNAVFRCQNDIQSNPAFPIGTNITQLLFNSCSTFALHAGDPTQIGYKRGGSPFETVFENINDMFVANGGLHIVDQWGVAHYDLAASVVVQYAGLPVITFNSNLSSSSEGQTGAVAGHNFINIKARQNIPVNALLSSVRFVTKGGNGIFQAMSDSTISERSDAFTSGGNRAIHLFRIDDSVPIQTQEYCAFEDVTIDEDQLQNLVHIQSLVSSSDNNLIDILSSSGLVNLQEFNKILSASWIQRRTPAGIMSDFGVSCLKPHIGFSRPSTAN